MCDFRPYLRNNGRAQQQIQLLGRLSVQYTAIYTILAETPLFGNAFAAYSFRYQYIRTLEMDSSQQGRREFIQKKRVESHKSNMATKRIFSNNYIYS